MAENKVKFGLCDVHIFPIKDEETMTYDEGFALPGAVKLSVKPEGKASSFFADNYKYWSVSSNQGYSGDVEIALLTNEFKTKILGDIYNEQTGMLTELADAIAKPFGMTFRVDGDQTNSIISFYKCTVERPGSEYETKGEEISPKTDTFAITVLPCKIGDQLVTKSAIQKNESNASIYNKALTDIQKPNVTLTA